jgi:DNA-binding MarR family transcriptional regulator
VEDQELSEQVASIERLMLRVAWLEQRRFAQDLSDFGLTVPQFFVLRSILLRGQQRTMGALADDTLQCSATMTGIVDRLGRMGLVSRERDARDRRRVLVELTPAGRKVLGKVRRSRERRLRETLAYLPEHDARQLLRLLRLYLEAFKRHYEEADEEPMPESSTAAE